MSIYVIARSLLKGETKKKDERLPAARNNTCSPDMPFNLLIAADRLKHQPDDLSTSRRREMWMCRVRLRSSLLTSLSPDGHGLCWREDYPLRLDLWRLLWWRWSRLRRPLWAEIESYVFACFWGERSSKRCIEKIVWVLDVRGFPPSTIARDTVDGKKGNGIWFAVVAGGGGKLLNADGKTWISKVYVYSMRSPSMKVHDWQLNFCCSDIVILIVGHWVLLEGKEIL